MRGAVRVEPKATVTPTEPDMPRDSPPHIWRRAPHATGVAREAQLTRS